MIPVKVLSDTPTYGASTRPARISSTSTEPDATNTNAPDIQRGIVFGIGWKLGAELGTSTATLDP